MGRRFGFRNVQVFLWAMDLPAPPAFPVASIRCRPLETGEAGTLAPALGLAHDGVTTRQAWSQCYAGRVGDEVATSGWVSEVDTWVGEMAATIRPGKDEAYIWDCQTAPPFRRRGFYRDLLTQIMADLGRRGRRRAWIATLGRPSGGYRGVKRAGFHPVLLIRYVQLGPLRWWRVRAQRTGQADEIQAARRALRLGEIPDRAGATTPSAAPPAPVPNR